MDPRESSPLTHSEHLADVLREQGATAAEIVEWTPAVQRLAEWPERQVSLADTHRLIAALAPLVPAPSAVRQALRARSSAQRTGLSGLVALVETARAQISVLRPSFWLVSAAITLLGAYTELSSEGGDSVFFLQALGPLLAFLGISSAFRGAGLRTLEYELACPPSPLQLMVARLVVVLGYDVALGLCLAGGLWLHGGASLLAVTLHWLMPLLLVAGLALVLSLRIPFATAAGIVYVLWLSTLLALANQWGPVPADLVMRLANPSVEVILGMIGLVGIAAALLCLPRRLSVVLPIA